MKATRFVRTIADLGPGNHACCLFETEREHWAALAPFLRRGLARREKALCMMDGPAAERAWRRLSDDGVDIEPHRARGQLAVLGSGDTFVRRDVFDPDAMVDLLRAEAERVRAEGYSGLCVAADMTWALRRAPEARVLMEYEAGLNDFCGDSGCLAMCLYDRRRFEPALLLDVLRAHPLAVVSANVYKNMYYVPESARQAEGARAILRHWLAHLEECCRIRERLMKRHNLTTRILQSLNESGERPRVISQILELVKEHTGFQTVAIRLRKGDPPLHVQAGGSPDELVEADQGSRAQAGRLVPDPERNSRLERLCADVMAGRADASLPFFTEGGSFWTNSTTEPLGDGTEKDAQEHARGPLGPPGYESVAFIPLRSGDEVVGVLQLQDRRRDQLTPQMVRFFERIALSVGIALKRSRREEALRQSEERVRRIIKHMPVLMDAFDAEGAVVVWNKECERVTGYSAEEFVGNPRALEILYPDAEYRERMMSQLRLRWGHFRDWEWDLRTKDGTIRTIAWSSISGDLPVPGWDAWAVGVDVTERRQAEEALRQSEANFRALAENALGGILIAADEGRHVYANRHLAELTGYTVAELCQMGIQDLVHPDQRQRLMKGHTDRLAGRPAPKHCETIIVRKDGKSVPVEVSAALTLWHGKPAALGIVRDLTRQKRIQEQLTQSAKMMSLGVMAGGIAHELRNPLGIISANAQLLLGHPDDAHIRSQCAGKIHRATQRASDIIENLLRFARPQDTRMRKVDLRNVLVQTLTLTSHQMRRRKITLIKDIRADVPLVWGNPEVLENILANLILNACNAMPRGGTLTISAGANRKGQAEFRFTDTGRGIPREDLSRVFDPFFTTMPVGEGIGLGLSICSTIIEQHRGTIDVASEPGAGTTFTVRLPGIH